MEPDGLQDLHQLLVYWDCSHNGTTASQMRVLIKRKYPASCGGVKEKKCLVDVRGQGSEWAEWLEST